MKMRVSVVIVFLVVAVIPFAVADNDKDDKQTVTGHVDIASLNINKYSFAAIDHGNGRFSGQFEFEQTRGDVTLRVHGSVDCLAVIGNRARLGGTVRHTSDPDIFPVGTQFIWSVTDNGEGNKDGRDTASEMRGGNAFAYCLGGLSFPDEAPLRRGNVQVRP